MKSFAIFLIKCAVLWGVLLIGHMLSGMVVVAMSHVPALPEHDGPLSNAQALLAVSAVHGLILALLASRLRWQGWRKALAIFTVFYVVATALNMIETVYFNAFVRIEPDILGALLIGDLLKAGLVSIAATGLWRGENEPGDRIEGWLWKMPLIAGIYVLFYFAAGHFIAWQGAAVRDYYAQGQTIDDVKLMVFQFGRGLIWAACAWVLASGLKGSGVERSVVTGLTFALFMASALLFPNAYMPWDVRKYHLVEILSSNALFGALAIQILRLGKAKL